MESNITGNKGIEIVTKLRNLITKQKPISYSSILIEIMAIANLKRINDVLKSELQDCGVLTVDCSSGKPSASDISIIVEIMKFTHKVPPPAMIVLISGDGDFGKCMHYLESLGYIILILHGSTCSESLKKGRFICIPWRSIHSLTDASPPSMTSSLSSSLMSCKLTKSIDQQHSSLEFMRRKSKSITALNRFILTKKTFSMTKSHSTSELNRLASVVDASQPTMTSKVISPSKNPPKIQILTRPPKEVNQSPEVKQVEVKQSEDDERYYEEIVYKKQVV